MLAAVIYLQLYVCVKIVKDFFRKRSDGPCGKDSRNSVKFHVRLGKKSGSG